MVRELISPWAVFLDRDGTLNEHVGLVSEPDQLELISGVAAGLRRLHEAGAQLVLVTNQPVIARELTDESGLQRIHDRLQQLLVDEGVRLDAIYYCPHHPETHHPEANNPEYRRECDCRKPKPGMIRQAAADLGLDLARSCMVGDSTRDIAAARAAGCAAVLVRTGSAGEDGVCEGVEPDAVVDDVSAAADWILKNRNTA